MAYRAVLFDLGGVVFESPLAFITEYEQRRGLPKHFVALTVGGYGGPEGPWQRLERGDIPLAEFCSQFDADARARGVALDSRELMHEMHARSTVRPGMVAAIRKIREAGLKVGALTNNWAVGDDYDDQMRPLRAEFDLFVESCKVRLRKPDPRIFEHAREGLGVNAAEIVFLDDIGTNLKAAKALGMRTIKVDAPEDALRELGETLALSLGG